MAIDRAAILRNAEKLAREGELDQAIAEYVRIVDDQPNDWNSANALGDLYVRAGLLADAIEQFRRIAEGLIEQGFLPKAAALYKKILKIQPDDEAALMRSAEIAAGQGRLADARAALQALAHQREARGDARGVMEIGIRLDSLDPDDLSARLSAARARLQLDDRTGAVAAFAAIATSLEEKDRRDEALAVLREAVSVAPDDAAVRRWLAAACLAAGDMDSAAEYATADMANDDPQFTLRIAERRLRGGRIEEGMAIVRQLLARDVNRRQDVALLGWTLAESVPDVGYQLVDVSADAAIGESDWPSAAAGLQEFVTRVPNHVPALMRLVEICVDGGLEATMYSAQAQLADAYIAAGAAAQARALAEDLVAREPWERINLERFRRSLELLGVPDPDAVIAERLSGQSPFISTDSTIARAATNPVAQPSSSPAHEGAPSPVAVAPSPAAVAPSTDIDLNLALGALDGRPDADPGADRSAQSAGAVEDQTDDIDSVFAHLRDAVSPYSAAAAERDLTRGIALYSAGAIDDAIEALAIACRAPQVCFRSASLAGRILRERGEIEKAIEFFERAADAPATSAADGRDLLYELAQALESSGESARALAVYLEIQADAADFRDVAARADRLAKVQAGR